MPYLETVEELAEALADMLGIYNQGLRLVGVADAKNVEDPGTYDHADTCACRMCWTGALAVRIRAAVTHDHLLESIAHAKDESHA